MGSDALKDLRAWQREQASQQEKALRSARRARQLIDDLDAKRTVAIDKLANALAALEATGLGREQCAAFLDVVPAELARLAGSRKRPVSGVEPGRTDSTVGP